MVDSELNLQYRYVVPLHGQHIMGDSLCADHESFSSSDSSLNAGFRSNHPLLLGLNNDALVVEDENRGARFLSFGVDFDPQALSLLQICV